MGFQYDSCRNQLFSIIFTLNSQNETRWKNNRYCTELYFKLNRIVSNGF